MLSNPRQFNNDSYNGLQVTTSDSPLDYVGESTLEPNVHSHVCHQALMHTLPDSTWPTNILRLFRGLLQLPEHWGLGPKQTVRTPTPPPSTHPRTIYNIFSITISGILQTTNTKAIYTFKFAIFKNTSISDAVQNPQLRSPHFKNPQLLSPHLFFLTTLFTHSILSP